MVVLIEVLPEPESLSRLESPPRVEAAVLPIASRLHTAAEFSEVVRQGRRASRPLVTVHALVAPSAPAGRSSLAYGDATAAQRPPRAGLVVSKAVGNSVVRHRTSRRLRHLLRDRLGALPDGTRVVVRAAAGAGSAPSTVLAAELDSALRSALRPRNPR